MATQAPPKDTSNRRALWLSVGLVVAGFAITFSFVDPPPPTSFKLGTGGPAGAYHAWGRALADAVAPDGFEIELVPGDGSLQNLERLRAGEIDVAFVQGGTTATDDDMQLKALGAVAFEPLWILQRREDSELALADLRGARLHAGPEGSGTRAVLVELLEVVGLGPGDVQLLDLPRQQWASSLRSGELDAACLVTGPRAHSLAELLEESGTDLSLRSLGQAEALSRHLPYLAHLSVPVGLLAPGLQRPPTDIEVVAPTASLVARLDFHEALPPLLLERCAEIFGGPGLLAGRDHFPAAAPVDLPLGDTAAHHLKHGPSFLHRVLPFRVASTLQRLLILLLPLLTLLIPIVKLAPPLLRWRHRSRIYRWYADLRRLEGEARGAQSPAALDAVAVELEQIDEEISQVAVPLSYHEELYNLRLHLGVVQRDLDDARARDEQREKS
ncbi:MAG: hypothetical protein DHS20C15_25470 [Planctomycetota bacterium]|nr:MAG: hypothetical protein DHS20C15_25470 [Planctomycetota bacterium]